MGLLLILAGSFPDSLDQLYKQNNLQMKLRKNRLLFSPDPIRILCFQLAEPRQDQIFSHLIESVHADSYSIDTFHY